MSKSKTNPNEKEIKLYANLITPFLNIPFYVACDPRISSHAKLVYGVFKMRSFNTDNPNCCWPSQETISTNLAMPVSKVKSAIQNLQEFGLIKVVQKKGNQGRRNEYHLCDLDEVYLWQCRDKVEWKTLDAVTDMAKDVTENHLRDIERIAHGEHYNVQNENKSVDSLVQRSVLQ